MPFSLLIRSAPRCLVAPSKIAGALDWKKRSSAILSIHIGTSTIDLAATSHPGIDENPVLPLPSIPMHLETRLNEKKLKPQVLEEISSVVEDFAVCGTVVSWPVQRQGWAGSSCGKVLHFLDQIVDDTPIGSSETPVCLWNGRHWTSAEDEWGRTAIYSTTTLKTEHVASKEQYKEDGMVATEIAHDFLAFHWPDLLEERKPRHDHHVGSFTATASPRKSKCPKSLIWERH